MGDLEDAFSGVPKSRICHLSTPTVLVQVSSLCQDSSTIASFLLSHLTFIQKFRDSALQRYSYEKARRIETAIGTQASKKILSLRFPERSP